MSRERIIQEEILTSVMREMQKDFYDEKWWKNTKVDKLPLILGATTIGIKFIEEK